MVTSGLDRQLAASERIAIGAPAPRVLEALRRATAFRTRFASEVAGDPDDAPARALASEIAAASITHVGPALPRLGGPLRVSAFGPRRVSGAEELRDPLGRLEAVLRARLGRRLISFEREGGELDRDPAGEGLLVVCTSSAWHDDDQAMRARQLLRSGGLLCALRSPYDASLVPDVPALLTYGDVPASIEALAAVLCGDSAPRGRCPVRLP
jgi:hypothetical protein